MEYSKHDYVVIMFMLILLLPALLCYSQETSKATYYGSPDSKGTPYGACGYGEYGRTVNDGDVTAVSRLYNGGAGCGACYKMKCTEPECNDDGVTVVVTDYGASSDDSDFIVSAQAFSKMAVSGYENRVKAYGHVNIEYQRVSCEYPDNNLMLKVHEHSHYPHYIALLLYYQAGFYDITSVDIFDEARQEWRACRRAYGAVWDMANPPRGDLSVRFFASSSANGEAKWVVADKVIPVTWRAGAAYDTSIQLS